MANFLAIEAASDSCSVALSCNGTLISRVEAAPRMHSRLLYPMLNDVMNEAGIRPNQLDAVIFGKGPGSFTGLRIAASTAQGIGFACDIPLIGVSTLQAMAQQAYQEQQQAQVLAIMDARMNELYLGQYALDTNTGLMTACVEDLICPINVQSDALNLLNADHFACGHGLNLWDKFDPSLQSLITQQDAQQVLKADSLFPQALSLFHSGKVLAPENIELVYLREQSHWKTIKQQKQQS
ncbi:tRNA (adenosine(37)-N6)-threonylcarbamoyltransferase complex dimerization subunit type 1 TsaB [Bermanella sp. WJH001]|uniref:tRNA (adenosine(37)-N6)-threonylcarbamoyltransferase complex dimerization subunit type 1 TsaB n=1 Tax=Bermanella sp. WJH001 TaxID=3048005 RepID=UPI0024BDB01D|nr:tRNA (adenosine(37)-N6)-threonylcarbamoyltransferase complex dimerization subunit type 1 TsaB [Bermanella sp. WJH001]MDJ1537473.1 tRNA (adenosine(37)-N6)-threonylcarbamoyltransferase complex dimerization subunit type 1 TsaB [Bermanella sp. WJH001]